MKRLLLNEVIPLKTKSRRGEDIARSGKSNPFDGMKYTRVCADPQGSAATAIILFDTGDGDVEWHTNTI